MKPTATIPAKADGQALTMTEETATAEGVSSTCPVYVRDLRKVYGKVTAVDRIGFSLKSATTVALLGGNGAGKTTTIAMLLGLVVPTSGEVRVFGADISKDRGLVAHRLNFQSPYVDLPMRLTVRQNLMVYAGLYGLAEPEARIAYLADQLQIEELLERPTGKLSAGQKTRVGLAKALLNAPDLLLLDEPTASLDPDTADWIRHKLKDYALTRRATLLLASHNMAEVERLADRVILLDRGRIVEDGTPRQLIDTYGRETLEEVFLDVVRGRANRDLAEERARAEELFEETS
jgi:ABC-2 type transport system ATP-binding protein